MPPPKKDEPGYAPPQGANLSDATMDITRIAKLCR
jgi:hypothetical protein